MFKFVKSSHTGRPNKKKVIITYSVSEIILGILLVAMVSFYIYNYLTNALYPSSANFSSAIAPSSQKTSPSTNYR